MRPDWKKSFVVAIALTSITLITSMAHLAHAQVVDDWYVIMQNPDPSSIFQFVTLEVWSDRSMAQDRAAVWRSCDSDLVQAAHAIPLKAAIAQINAGVLDQVSYLTDHKIACGGGTK